MAIETGKIISNTLSDLFNKALSPTDKRELSDKHNVTQSYIRQIITQHMRVNENNKSMIEEMLKRAKKNAKKDISHLQSILSQC